MRTSVGRGLGRETTPAGLDEQKLSPDRRDTIALPRGIATPVGWWLWPRRPAARAPTGTGGGFGGGTTGRAAGLRVIGLERAIPGNRPSGTPPEIRTRTDLTRRTAVAVKTSLRDPRAERCGVPAGREPLPEVDGRDSVGDPHGTQARAVRDDRAELPRRFRLARAREERCHGCSKCGSRPRDGDELLALQEVDLCRCRRAVGSRSRSSQECGHADSNGHQNRHTHSSKQPSSAAPTHGATTPCRTSRTVRG